MATDKLRLTATDLTELTTCDDEYLLDKGANLYTLGKYEQAVEYYHLATTLGNAQAMANLGYCYLYGRHIKQNLDLALAYFKVAALKENIDAAYKLGDIYESDKWGIQDDELSEYYYHQAVSFILGTEHEKSELLGCYHKLQQYPSLCLALARKKIKNGISLTDFSEAYQLLKHAEIGYLHELNSGHDMYLKSYERVKHLLADQKFDLIRGKYDKLFIDEY
ncbi:sel1 repeat family protein [Ligilactobacillus murinus]|nr:sel1 repeat family protein [Ligilactobacillus murinus]